MEWKASKMLIAKTDKKGVFTEFFTRSKKKID